MVRVSGDEFQWPKASLYGKGDQSDFFGVAVGGSAIQNEGKERRAFN